MLVVEDGLLQVYHWTVARMMTRDTMLVLALL
jgi:hypothetical protein